MTNQVAAILMFMGLVLSMLIYVQVFEVKHNKK